MSIDPTGMTTVNRYHQSLLLWREIYIPDEHVIALIRCDEKSACHEELTLPWVQRARPQMRITITEEIVTSLGQHPDGDF